MDFCICGSIAGVADAFILAPADHFRIKMQVQGKVDPRGDPVYKNDMDCIKTITKNYGIRGAYKGLTATVLRESLASGSYFGSYEYIVNNYLIPKGGTKKDVDAWKLFVTGGISGYFFWGPWYPFDAIKSKIQSDSLTNPRYSGILDCAKKTFATDGIAGFYKGFWPCMLRAFPVNSASFLTYELTMRAIS